MPHVVKFNEKEEKVLCRLILYDMIRYINVCPKAAATRREPDI